MWFILITWINLLEPVGSKKLRSFGVGDIAWTGRRVDCLPFVVECLMIVQAKQAVGDNLLCFQLEQEEPF